MRSGGSLSTTKRSRLPLALILAIIAVSGGGLFVLGLAATDSGEAKARLRAREALGSAAIALSEAARGLVREADLAAEARERDSPLLDALFLADASGEILLPERTRHPPLPPPPAAEVEAVRKILAAVEGEAAVGEAPVKALALAEGALADFAHPDLVTTLADRVAELYLRGGVPERALFLSRQIVTDFPSARDLAGEPLAPTSWLRILRVLEEPDARRAAALEFARLLVDDAFGLPRRERDLLLERAEEALEPEPLPAELQGRLSLFDALRARVIPEARDRPAGLESDAGWRHLVRDGDRGPEIFGFREIRLRGEPHVFGYRMAGRELARRLRAAAEEIVAELSIRIEIGLLPVLSVGESPAVGALERRSDLGGDLRGIALRLSAAPPGGFRMLAVLHAAMTVLLAGALAAGVLLSLRAVRREIETARVRQHLVDNVSHELRTPLTTIRMHAEMLSDEADLPEEKRTEYLDRVLSEAERLSRLVEDVLDLSRLSRGEAGLVPEAVEPAAVAGEAAERVRAIATGPVETAVPRGLPPVRADRDATVRVLVNLLSNAIRYSSEGGGIRLEATREGGAIRFTVTDRGPGIEPEAREHLFDRFYRAPRDARRVKGAGIGLALAREIARAQGGDVTLEETSADGSTFALTLPVAEVRE